MSDRFSNLKEIKKESISVDFFYESCKERFRLHKVSQNKISPDKLITDKDIHRPGLALAGYIDLFTYKRIQVLLIYSPIKEFRSLVIRKSDT